MITNVEELSGPTVDRRARTLCMALVIGAVTIAVTGGSWVTNPDLISDIEAATRPLWSALARTSALAAVTLLGVCAVHYVAAAVAARAASGTALPFGELTVAQLAASAANRVTPAGLGGSTVIVRYLMRRGRLDVAGATAAVSALALLGGTADALGLVLVIGIGMVLGLPGASSEVPLLLGKFAQLVPLPSGTWLYALVPAVAAVVGMGLALRRRQAALVRRAVEAVVGYGRVLAALVRQPARLVVLLFASAGTTLALAAGFAMAAVVPGHGLPATDFCALMIGFMVASAAGSAVPTPGGIGAVDGAQVAVLAAAGASTSNAIATVAVFRLITFWLPAVAGVVAARMLRRRGVL